MRVVGSACGTARVPSPPLAALIDGTVGSPHGLEISPLCSGESSAKSHVASDARWSSRDSCGLYLQRGERAVATITIARRNVARGGAAVLQPRATNPLWPWRHMGRATQAKAPPPARATSPVASLCLRYVAPYIAHRTRSVRFEHPYCEYRYPYCHYRYPYCEYRYPYCEYRYPYCHYR